MAIIVRWTESAKAGLREIFDYYNDVAGVRTARKITGKILEASRTLTHTPRSGQREWLLGDQPEEYRRLIVENYKIVYVVVGDKIYIVNIFDCRRNPEHLRESFREKNGDRKKQLYLC